MKKLSEIKGEHALDVLAEIIEPATEIFSDPKIEKVMKSKKAKRVDVVKAILKGHKKSILTIMAILDEKDPETYEPSVIEIPVKLIALLNDPAFSDFFLSQGQEEVKSSGSATENTEADEK